MTRHNRSSLRITHVPTPTTKSLDLLIFARVLLIRELAVRAGTGNNPMTMGNNIDTYGGGFAQHVYLHANKIASVWGNDREVLTTDGDESVGDFAAGKAQEISSDGTNITLDCYAKPGTGNARGGQVAIIAGGAAGQIRRIVVSKATAIDCLLSLVTI